MKTQTEQNRTELKPYCLVLRFYSNGFKFKVMVVLK